MKKLIALIIAACLIGISVFVLSTWDREEEVDLSAKVEQKISAYRTDLEDSASTLTSTKAIKKYLSNWAESKGIDYSTDENDNVIMKIKASSAYKNTPPTVVLCSYDAKHLDYCIDPMSVALYVAKNHEDTGKLTVIFTNDQAHTFTGMETLDKKYFPDDANVFCLNGGSKNMWSTATAGCSTYAFTSQVEHTETEGNKAYKISIQNLPGGIPDLKIGSYPNPIKELGDLLAYFKTNSLIYELAEIQGGTSGSLYPNSASVIIVIDENDQEKFDKRITTAIENFNGKYGKYYPNAAYSYEEVSLPEEVLSSEDMNQFVSLLYTLIDGVYERDEEDEILSITNIGAISCEEDTYTISASGNGLNTKGLNQIDLSYTTICGLSDIKYEKTSSLEAWSIENPDDDVFVQDVASAFKEYSDGEMDYKTNITATNCSYVYKKNPNCNLINVSVNQARIEKYAGTIITFMINLLNTEVSD